MPRKSRDDRTVWRAAGVRQRWNHGGPESKSPGGVFLRAALKWWSGSSARWTAPVEGSSVALARGMSGARYALRSRNPGPAWAQEAEARGYREAGVY